MGDDAVSADLEESIDVMCKTLANLTGKLSDLTTQFAALKLLIPLAKKLDDIHEKVTALQASAFENSEQVRALNLTVACLEQGHRDGKQPSDPDPDGRIRTRREHTDHHEPDDTRDARPFSCAKLEFLLFDGRDDPLPWLNCCETFFRGQETPNNRKV